MRGGGADLQRVLRGCAMIGMEAARTQGPDAARCVQTTVSHLQGFISSLEQASRAARGGRSAGSAGSGSGAAPAAAPAAAHSGAAAAASAEQALSPFHASKPREQGGVDLAVAAGLSPPPLAPLPALAPPPAPQSPLPPPPLPLPVPPLPQAATPAPLTQAAQAAPAAVAPAGGAAGAGAPQPPAPRKKRTFRELSVPASPIARLWGFGTLAASLATGALGEALVRVVRGAPEAAAAAAPAAAPATAEGAAQGAAGAPAAAAPPQAARTPPPTQLYLSPAQAERLAEGLCRLRGAALKLGQMLSLADEALIPPAIAEVLERVRSQADIMPSKQLHAQLSAELGEGWREKLGGAAFGDAPVAAASIGQVHRSTLGDGTAVAIKVQYPGVAESIDSDLDNLKRLLTYANFLPKGLYLDPMIAVAREELRLECDYVHEATAQRRYQALVADDPDFIVPTVISALSTRRVLTTTWLPGVPIDQVVEASGGLGQEDRNRIARKLLKLTLKELFEWRYMQVRLAWGAGRGG